MASIVIDNASVSYFLQRKGGVHGKLERGAVGGQIIIRQRYLEIAALRGISLSFADGDRVGVVGINGSGKSTLLKLCAGALATQFGSITVNGKLAAQFSLGSGIKPTLSGRRNTELKCLYMGIPQRTISARVDRVKELSGLEGYFELPVSSYSAGMRSRLVMSMLSLMRAEILVMDEWIGAADTTVSQTANDLQSELINSANIVVMASHSRSVLETWTNRVVWLDGGEVKLDGPTAEVLEAYYTQTKAAAAAKAKPKA